MTPLKIQSDAGWITVDAIIAGQWAVHLSVSGETKGDYTVTHIKTGYALCAYTAQHVAVNLAKRLNALYDFDPIAKRALKGKLTAQDRVIVKELRRIVKHECYTEVYMPPSQARPLSEEV